MIKTTDVAIIGGGVIGCAAAYALATAGLRVLLLERGQIACEASGEAAGMLAPQAEASEVGPFLTLGLQSRELFPALTAALREETGLDVGYGQDGTLYPCLDEDEETEARTRFAWQRGQGLPVEWWGAEEVRKAEPGIHPAVRGALFIPGDRQVTSGTFTRAFALAAARRGAEIWEGAPVTGFVRDRKRIVGVKNLDRTVSAGRYVLAAGPWSAQIAALLGLPVPVLPVKGQLCMAGLLQGGPRHILYSHLAYLVPRPGGEVVLGTTVEFAGFDKRVTVGGLQGILAGAQALYPALAGAPLLRAWAGLRPYTSDELPLLGPVPEMEELLVATGHHRNGILLAPITAQLLRELVVDGRTSTPLAPFRVDRELVPRGPEAR
ncbi:MAG TPA: glycine oxidase ThiO [Candidatus Methylomirabilis sp.]|nr:glycine oxidase ThiO [Candidatus Methylomirabilis sp.]